MRSKTGSYSTFHQVYFLSDILSFHGVETAVICPGSRNTPLIEGFNSHKKITCLSIVDERSAAYFALGIAQQSDKPVAIITTSGTATLNLAPAIAEAYYQGTPLVIITADRPPEWIDQEDNQAIRQKDIFRNYIKYSCELPVDVSKKSDNSFAQRIINEALIHSKEFKKGPVHINVPFKEPLYEISAKRSRGRKISRLPLVTQISNTELTELIDIWKECHRRMIIIGTLTDAEQKGLKKCFNYFLRFKQAVIIAETTSNLNEINVIQGFDNFLLEYESFNENKPELVVVLGRNFISKKIKQFIRKSNPKHIWSLNKDEKLIDTFSNLTVNIQVYPETLLKRLIQNQEYVFNNNYFDFWNKYYIQIQKLKTNYLMKAPFSDFSAMKQILNIIPKDSFLQLGNSMPVRYFELLMKKKNLYVYSNRGTSGIDGGVSTAAGAAWFQKENFTTLIVGDLSFFYDSNALWNSHIIPNFKIIILNNSGGNIFDIIDGPSNFPLNKPYLTTNHNREAESLVKSFGLNYYSAVNADELEDNLKLLYNDNGKATVLEVFTNPQINAQVFKNYIQYIKSNSNDTTRMEDN